MKRIIFIVFVGLFALLEWGSWYFSQSKLMNEPIDIQTANVIKLKLNQFLSSTSSPRALFIGDSVMNGATLGAHGDKSWREHTIDQNFKKIAPQWSTLNLGFNGALPCDLCALYQNYLIDFPLDLVVLDIGVRSFSSDFNDASAALSRPWLTDFRWKDKRLQLAEAVHSRGAAETKAHTWLVNHSYFWGVRDFFQWRFMGGTLSQLIPSAVKAVQQKKEDDSALSELLLAKSRYATIRIQPDFQQVSCLKTLLKALSDRGTQTVIFLTIEKPGTGAILLDEQRLAQLRTDLKGVIQASAASNVRYIETIPGLTAQNYLDHLHVDAKGNAFIAKALHDELVLG